MPDSEEIAQLGPVEALVLETYGLRLLAYLCATDEQTMRGRLEGETELPPAAEKVLAEELVPLAQYVATRLVTEPDLPRSFSLEGLGRRTDDGRSSIGNAFRKAAGGHVPEVSLDIAGDPVKSAIAQMAVDSYPLLLVPPDWSIRSLPLYQHPLRDELQAAVRADPALGRLFAKDTSALGASGFIYTSLGRGNTIQASRFGEVIIVSAWDTATMASGSVCLDQLVEQAIRNIDTLRDAVNGGNPRVRALVAFTGFTTNDAQPISTPWGPLRPLHEWERELAPTALRGTVSGAHPDGRQVTVSYSGEMVLETEVPYAVLIDYMLDLENLPPKLPTIEGADTLRRRLEGIQLATVLATDRPAGSWVAARPAWTWIGDPFGYGPNIAWSDARSSPGFMPYELTPAECDSVAQWTGLVEAHWSPRIDIAVRRLLSAANARTDMADRLVDSVIVWENLFGTVEGEPRLRISAALAWLLTGDPIDREARQLELKRLYDYRSKIVHGGKPDEVALGEQANAALMHARDALRALFSDRTDVLALPDGAARSLRMIMGG